MPDGSDGGIEVRCPKCSAENLPESRFCSYCGQELSPVSQISTMDTPEGKSPQVPVKSPHVGRIFSSDSFSAGGFTPGTILADRYRIIGLLGRGGMGEVYRADDLKLGQPVALKFLPPALAEDSVRRERFFAEVRITRQLSHPNICRVYDIGEVDGRHFLSMEYIDGEDLASLMKRIGSLTNEKALDIAQQLVAGMTVAHERGVLHRDLKPANIMLDGHGRVRITDFGLAIAVGDESQAEEVAGTPAYMSPEQLAGKGATVHSDIYSLGLILYEIYTGKKAFTAKTLTELREQKETQTPRAPSEIREGIDPVVERVIQRCMEKDKQNRFQSIDELRSALKNAEREMHTAVSEFHEKNPAEPKEIILTFAHKRFHIPALIAITLLIMTALLWLVFKQGGKEISSGSRPSIAVISFDNQTGDENYDRLRRIIPNLIITSLEQSGNFYVMTWERMNDLLKQLGRKDTDIIDRELGFELCHLENINYIVLGSVAKLGKIFATDVKILDVQSKELLRSASARGNSEASILESQIDELSKQISREIGLSDRKITAESPKITAVTTSSMDAYKEFLKGVEKHERYYYKEARIYLENAINLDPNFAAAHYWLALTCGELGDTRVRIETIKRAKVLAEKANEKDRLSIYALYAEVIENDIGKGIRIWEELAGKYPREKRAHYRLGVLYWSKREFLAAIDSYRKALALDPNYGSALNGLGYAYADMKNFEKAIESFEKYASVTPGDANPLDSLAEIYFQIGQFDNSIQKYEEAIKIQSDFFEAYWRVAYVYALKEEYKKALAWIEQLIARSPSPGIKAEAYLWKAFYHHWIGERELSLRTLKLASNQAEQVDNKFCQAYVAWIESWIQYNRGDLESYKSLIQLWFELMSEHTHSYRPAPSKQLYSMEYSFFLGLSDLSQGRIDLAKSRLKEMEALMPQIDPVFRSQVVHYDFRLLHGEVLLAERALNEALSLFAAEGSWEIPYMHSWVILLYNAPYPRDVLAKIYQKRGDLDKAIAEYKRLIAFDPKSKERRLIHPLFYYRLAKLYELRDWRGGAIESYEKFIDIHKNADTEMSEVEDSKERLRGLKQ